MCDSCVATQLLRWSLAPQIWYLQGIIPNIIVDLKIREFILPQDWHLLLYCEIINEMDNA